jgi:iron complex outermembrane recepter protein
MKSISQRIGASVSLAVAFALGAVAPALAADEANSEQIQEVVVTGSRIVVPNMVATSPTQVVTAEDIRTAGKVDINDIILQMPQNIDAGLGQDLGNRTSGLTTAGGVATADLRGLGPNRTLVLVDGIRLGIGSPNTFIQQPAPDLDQIPAFLLERVDVVTGGASATYGSDAIGGVINFIMKKNFEGLQVDGQIGANFHNNSNSTVAPLVDKYAQTQPGLKRASGTSWDGQNRQFDIIFGANFADGKGNVTGYFSFFDTDPVTGAQRDWDQCQLNPVVKGGNITGRVCGGSSNSNYFSPQPNSPGFNFPVGPGVDDPNNPYSVLGNQFIPNGSALTNPPASFNSQPYIYLTRGDTRYAAGFLAHVDITDWARPYAQFYFTDDRTKQAIAPDAIFIDNNIFDPMGAGYYYTNCSNPLLSAQQQALLCSPAGIAADTANPGTAVVPIDLRRRNVEGGGRVSFYDHSSYRAVLGSKGDFADAWSYDAYGQFYYVNFFQSNPGYYNLQSVNNSLLVSGTAANPVCAPVVTDTTCVPYNIWKDGGVTQDQLKYLYLTGTSQGSYTMRTAHADVTGDLGKYGIKLPTARDGVALNFGFEHRHENQVYQPDSAEQSGLMLGAGAAAIPLDVGDSVSEFFAEARVPLVQDAAFAKELVFDTGIRSSDYSVSGKVTTDKFEVQWAPTEDIRFRAGFQKAIRAPNLIELFNPQNAGLTTYGFDDPCAGPAPSASLAQCLHTVSAAQAAAFTAAYNAGQIPQLVAQQGYQLTGGNEKLTPEVSKSYNVGFTFTPRFAEGLSGSVDYYHIRLDNEVAAGLPIQNIVTNCLATGNPTVCGLIVRNFANFGLNGPIQATGGYVTQTSINIASALVSGVDVQLNYKHALPAGLGTFNIQMYGAYLMHASSQVPGGPGLQDCAGLYGPNCLAVNPRWRDNLRVAWNMPWDTTIAATWRYQGRVGYDGNDQTFCGADPGTPCTGLNLVNGTIPGYSFVDLAATYTPSKNVELRFGINNILDKDPPLAFGGAGGGYNSYTAYDFLGRQFFLGATVKF